MNYRRDIDGLRAIAVTAVIVYHLGFLPSGYLGVDIFFVISGYLITSIVYRRAAGHEFSILDFYLRRIRRIIPLLLVVTAIAFAFGYFHMLPDDLENLSQSVVASNLSANNLLMYLTSADYWAVKNEFKPLMHTWSLGIEEQFYLFFPVLFFFLQGTRVRYVKPILATLSLLSVGAFLLEQSTAAKFYFIHYRFYELAAGGLGALYLNAAVSRLSVSVLQPVCAVALFAIGALLTLPLGLSNELLILSTTFAATTLLVGGHGLHREAGWYRWMMSSAGPVFVGQISYSLYMWHQPVFAYARYAYLDHITPFWAVALTAVTLLLSILTYYGVENTFRNKRLVSTPTVLLSLGVMFLLTTGLALRTYSIGGIVRDYPSLALQRDAIDRPDGIIGGRSKVHIRYNEDVWALDRAFDPTDCGRLKTLVVGNSFGRDAVNLLLESAFAPEIQVRYTEWRYLLERDSMRSRLIEADRILLAAQGFVGMDYLDRLEAAHGITIDRDKVWILGTKDFGASNGIHYNRLPSIMNVTEYRTAMKAGTRERNARLRAEWGAHYIDLIATISDKAGRVRVFTDGGRFISQDTVHLTKDGATFLAGRLHRYLYTIFGPTSGTTVASVQVS